MRAAPASAWRRFLRDREGLSGLVVLILFAFMAVFADLLADPAGLDVTKATGKALEAPSWAFPLGTDHAGRSVLTMIVHGSQTTLLVGLAATVISMVLGTLIGVASGHFSGLIGGTLNRLIEWFLVIPYLPLAIVLATVFPPGLPKLVSVIVVIGVTSWSGTARLVRAQTMAIEARPYLERARALGGGHWHQMTRHVLPNVMPLVLANTTLTVSIAIIAETTLSFLGLGDPLRVSWGRILEQAHDLGAIDLNAWWWVLAPGIAVVLTVRAFNMCGRALERILDPRLEM
ncbi:ABC transporter permease [Catellatospora sp. KI3]|uniref:ABC transporter permease n=1 Tax=Catellatospora sp. KI3 TaxID=3041620 RepID=UPI002482C031|nr:ABC transporter permease [Catellatospora sp. KI3]MDI1462003.1 ABC transporter permease [Catellatospora sp. KI3]